MGEFDIVVEAVLHRGTGGELSLWPDVEDGVGQHMGAGVPDGFEFGHWKRCLG